MDEEKKQEIKEVLTNLTKYIETLNIYLTSKYKELDAKQKDANICNRSGTCSSNL